MRDTFTFRQGEPAGRGVERGGLCERLAQSGGLLTRSHYGRTGLIQRAAALATGVGAALLRALYGALRAQALRIAQGARWHLRT